jgi:nucleotide-binding universal stress UspA family protein
LSKKSTGPLDAKLPSGIGDANSILVPLDGSEEANSALPYAAALAGRNGPIELLTVVLSENDPADGGEASAQAALDAAGADLRAHGYDVKTRILVGDPAGHIVEAAANGGAYMIVMASHGRGAIDRLFRGSVAEKVAREATVPVMVVRSAPAAQGTATISRLVLPLDGSPLAEESLPVATALSRRLAAPLDLVRAVNIAEFMPPAVGMGEAIPFDVYDQTQEELEQDARQYLDSQAEKLRAEGLTVTTQILSGPPAAAITESTKAGDVIVLVSNERSGVMRWLMGSVAEELIRADDVPVVLVPASDTAAG